MYTLLFIWVCNYIYTHTYPTYGVWYSCHLQATCQTHALLQVYRYSMYTESQICVYASTCIHADLKNIHISSHASCHLQELRQVYVHSHRYTSTWTHTHTCLFRTQLTWFKIKQNLQAALCLVFQSAYLFPLVMHARALMAAQNYRTNTHTHINMRSEWNMCKT
jgi:hypothetical protein